MENVHGENAYTIRAVPRPWPPLPWYMCADHAGKMFGTAARLINCGLLRVGPRSMCPLWILISDAPLAVTAFTHANLRIFFMGSDKDVLWEKMFGRIWLIRIILIFFFKMVVGFLLCFISINKCFSRDPPTKRGQ